MAQISALNGRVFRVNFGRNFTYLEDPGIQRPTILAGVLEDDTNFTPCIQVH